jgi:hypothetical protein
MNTNLKKCKCGHEAYCLNIFYLFGFSLCESCYYILTKYNRYNPNEGEVKQFIKERLPK